MRTTRTFQALSILLGMTPALAAQAEFEILGDLAGGGPTGYCGGISADGAAISGSSDAGTGVGYRLSFRWTEATGMVGLGDLAGAEDNGGCYGISPDGAFCVGGSRTQDDSYWQWHAFLHDGSTMLDLGTLPYVSDGWSHATDASNGGTVAVGYADHGDGYNQRAFRWRKGIGMEALALPTGYVSSTATAVTPDGSTIVGQMGGWGYPTQAFVFTEANGVVGIGGRMAQGISADGTVVLGISTNVAAYWTQASGWVDLPWGGWGDGEGAFAISADHEVIVGHDRYHAYYRTPEGGTRWLENVLRDEHGVDLAGWQPMDQRGISDDGTVVAGSAYHAASGTWQPYRAVVPRTRWERMGYGLAGTGGGIPNLYGRGDLAAGGRGFLAVESARAGMPVFFIVGLTAIYAPFFKGTLVPSLDLILAGVYTDWLGNATIGGDLPSDLPPDVEFYAQAWILDPNGPKGFAATNAVKGVTQ